jgi:alkylation response protein AidB-like acyl-CoA dehydrogenase
MTIDSDDLREFASTVRDLASTVADGDPFLSGASDVPTLSPRSCREAAVKLGVTALLVDEPSAGLGGTAADAGLLVGPWTSTLLTSDLSETLAVQFLLRRVESDAATDLLQQTMAGAATVRLPLLSNGGSLRAPGDGERMHGDALVDVSGATDDAIVLVMPATRDAGSRLFVGEFSMAAMAAPRDPVDPSRDLRLCDSSKVDVRPIAPLSDEDLDAVDRFRLTLTAFECIAGAQRVLEQAVRYSHERTQFGRPIGTFQALQHLLVDVHLKVEDALSLATRSAALIGDVAPASAEGRYAANVACLSAAEAYRSAAESCIQVHGGIGFTREITAHLHLRRAVGTIRLLKNHRRLSTTPPPSLVEGWRRTT